MGWTDDEGLHEGYAVPVFSNGDRGSGTSGSDWREWVRGPEVWDDAVAVAEAAVAPTGVNDSGWSFHRNEDWTGRPNGYWRRPNGEVTGWQVLCECSTRHDHGHTVWQGPIIARVPSKALERLDPNSPDDLGAFAPDERVVDRVEDADLDDLVRSLWRRHHVDPLEGAGAVRDAVAAVRAAQRRLDDAVAQARRGGVSWEVIGREVGVTRQAAHARWGDAVRLGQESHR